MVDIFVNHDGNYKHLYESMMQEGDRASSKRMIYKKVMKIILGK